MVSSSTLLADGPRARLRPLAHTPLDAITIYNTATHCYLLGTDALQQDYHLLTCRKHRLEEAVHFISSSAVHSANSESEADEWSRSGTSSPASFAGAPSPHRPARNRKFCQLADLHDYTSYAVYAPAEAAALVEALQRENGDSMQTLTAVALLGAVRFTEGYYLVVVTERRAAGYMGVHRFFEVVQVELISLLIDPAWVSAQIQAQQQQQQQRRAGELEGLASFSSTARVPIGQSGAGGGSLGSGSASFTNRWSSSFRKSSASAATYLFQRRSLEELYRQQFLSSISRSSSFFYTHSYDLTNTLQSQTLAEGAAMTREEARAAAAPREEGEEEIDEDDNVGNFVQLGSPRRRAATLCQSELPKQRRRQAATHSRRQPSPSWGNGGHPNAVLSPRMQYVWNEFLLEPWQLPGDGATDYFHRGDLDASFNSTTPPFFRSTSYVDGGGGSREAAMNSTPAPTPQYPSGFTRWCTWLMHGYITQRVVVVRRPSLHTLLITLIARVSKEAAGVRYLRRGVNADGHAANHVEVEQIVTDESRWNAAYTEGSWSSYVQLRGSVPVRWYHPPSASRLLPKPPIVVGPQDPEWSATCLHFQQLIAQYGAPILVHDLLKCKSHNTREYVLRDAYRTAVQALSAAVTRAAICRRQGGSAASGKAPDELDGEDTGGWGPPTDGKKEEEAQRSADVLQYTATDLRSLGPLAWNAMTAHAEHHFNSTNCFVCSRVPEPRRDGAVPASSSSPSSTTHASPAAAACEEPVDTESGVGDITVATRLQCGIVRSNCLDCIDRTNLGQLFHGLHALGEQLSGLGLLHDAADLRDSPAVSELLLDMYLAMGDVLATQYGGSAQVGAGVLHRGAGWDQLMGVKRLYNNVMGDRDKQEAMNLLLGRTQPQPRPYSRARNTAMHTPGQVLPYTAQNPLSAADSPNASFATFVSTSSVGAAPRHTMPLNSPLNFSGTTTTAASSSTAPSFFSGLLQTASKWWGDSGRAREDSASAANAALRAAQYAAAEAEAEADYYEQVSSRPHLPPMGLLATWWVQPWRVFVDWYAERGVRVKMHAVPVMSAQSTKSPSFSIMTMTVGEEDGVSMVSEAVRTPVTVAAPGDAFARHLLAADVRARRLWQHYVAAVERQACLASLEPSTSTRNTGTAASNGATTPTVTGTGVPPSPMAGAISSTGSSPLGALPLLTSPIATRATQARLAANVHRDALLSASSSPLSTHPPMSGMMAAHGMPRSTHSGRPLMRASGVADGAALQLSASAWCLDEVSMNDAPSLANINVPLQHRQQRSSGNGRSDAADLDASIAAVTTTIMPSLFLSPWVVLRSTTHVLPVMRTLVQSSSPLNGLTLTDKNTSGNRHTAAKTSPAVQLLREWRSGPPASAVPLFPDLVSIGTDPHGAKGQAPRERVLALSLMRQVFGQVPATVAAATAVVWDVTTWHSFATAYDHPGRPQLLRASTFTAHARELERLVNRAAMAIAEDIAPAEAKTFTAPQSQQQLSPAPASAMARRGGRTAQWPIQRYPHSRPAAIDLPNHIAGAVEESAVAPHVPDSDLVFVVALLTELFGPVEQWGAQDIIEVLQRLSYPALVPTRVIALVQHASLHPALSGLELVRTVAATTTANEAAMQAYWRRRLASAVAAEKTTVPADSADMVAPAVALLCRLCRVLRPLTARLPAMESAAAVAASSTPAPALSSPAGSSAPRHFPTRSQLSSLSLDEAAGASATSVLSMHGPSAVSNAGRGRGGVDGGGSDADTTTMADLLPLLAHHRDREATALARYQSFSPSHTAHAESMRRLWSLCQLMQPLFPASTLTPQCLHARLRAFLDAFSPLSDDAEDVAAVCVASRRARRGTKHHVRYAFQLSSAVAAITAPSVAQQQQQIRAQLAAGALAGLGGGSNGVNALRQDEDISSLHRPGSPMMAASPLPSAMTTAAQSSAAGSLHVPATLSVKDCCTAVELYRWCARARQTRSPSYRPSPISATPLSPLCAGSCVCTQEEEIEGEVPEETAMATWHLLWWAAENGFIAPVVRRQHQAMLEIMADETALFCLVDDIPRVALNVERRSRADVWRPAPPRCCRGHEQHHKDNRLGRHESRSAIFGAAFASAFPVHRLTRRSAVLDMLTISETLASLALTAATRVQEFFREHQRHGWTRTSIARLGGGGGEAGAPGRGGGGAAVAFFGGGGSGLAASTAVAGGITGSGANNPPEASSTAASASEIVHAFCVLAEECLQSLQSIMTALQYMSLEALAEDHAVHAYIAFFVNVYNAAYVTAWLTNVRELVSFSASATAATRASISAATSPVFRQDRSSPGSNNSGGAGGGSASGSGTNLRSIDLLPLPTLCNTSRSSFMSVYGVAVGRTFLSLAEMRYGVLGGNRAPPYREVPMWPSALSRVGGTASPHARSSSSCTCPPMGEKGTPTTVDGAASNGCAWAWWSLVPLHLSAEVPQSVRLSALQHHPHVEAMVELAELCHVYCPSKPATVDTMLSIFSPSPAGGAGGGGKATPQLRSPTSAHPAAAASFPGSTRSRLSSPASVDMALSSTSTPPPQIASLLRPSGGVPAAAVGGYEGGAGNTVRDSVALASVTAETQQRRYRARLVAAWAEDVVRYLPFRISLQLLDTYLPPPLLHLCPVVDSEGRVMGNAGLNSSGADAGMGAFSSSSTAARGGGAAGGRARLDVDGERVPWYLHPLLTSMPLVHPALQSTKLGMAYTVAGDEDGRAEGSLVPQINPDANGVVLQPCRMWSSPSYYLVGGDGVTAEEATAHAFLVLQALSGSYLGLGSYHVHESTGATTTHGSVRREGVQAPPLQHLCMPLRADDALAQLRATEAAFRSALRNADPFLVPDAVSSHANEHSYTNGAAAPRGTPLSGQSSLTGFNNTMNSGVSGVGARTNSPPPQPSVRGTFGMAAAPASCAAALLTAMKPVLFEWCRTVDPDTQSLTQLTKPGTQWRVMTKVLQLLEASHASGEAVRVAQAVVKDM